MSALRDLIAIIGSVGIGWFICCWNRYTEQGTVTGIVVGLVVVGITLAAIRSDSRRTNKAKADRSALELRNCYLETAIKQMGGDNLRE